MNKSSQKLLEKLEIMTIEEKALWKNGILVGGMDEAGRGPLAGPVVAACVIMPDNPLILGIDDSKKLSEKRRAEACEAIIQNAISIGIGMANHEEIDDINILNATKNAFVRAYENMDKKPKMLLVDAIKGLAIEAPQKAIIHGDAVSYIIAAASIIAKVTRDNLMAEYDELYPEYGFKRHKGYGTKAHISAIKEHGACPIHRMSFIKKFIEQ